jgi:hypothetical protein
MGFSEVLWEVVGSDGFVDGLMVRSWSWVLAMWFYLSLLSRLSASDVFIVPSSRKLSTDLRMSFPHVGSITKLPLPIIC